LIKEAHFLVPKSDDDPKDNFFAYYRALKTYDDFNKKQYIGSEYKCRYCGSTDRRDFKKDNSHTFPECTGNRWLYSKDECVNCNQHFSLYENELANHGHVMRTFLGIKTKKGNPTKYKTESLKLQRLESGFVMNMFDTKEKQIDPKKHGGLTFHVDFQKHKEEGTLSLPLKKFIPHYLFKCLVKIGLAIMPENEMVKGQFDYLKEWLLSLEVEDLESPYNYAYYGSLPFGDRKPIIQIYKKDSSFKDVAIPTYSLFFGYGNDIFQIFLPEVKSDEFIYKSGSVQLPIIPQLIGSTENKRGFQFIDGNVKDRVTSDGYKSFVF
jgi:hypothetical protein